MTIELNRALAEAVARAKNVLDCAISHLSEAEDRTAKIVARIAETSARQSEITCHRLDGKSKASETAELHAIALDLEALESLRVEACALADVLRQPVDVARADLGRAEAEWSNHQAEVEYAALLRRAREHESALLAAVRATIEAGKRAGHQNTRQSWKASRELERALQGMI